MLTGLSEIVGECFRGASKWIMDETSSVFRQPTWLSLGTLCWTNGFEYNKLAIFELKLQWSPQTFFGGSTWECVFLHEEMKIIY